METLIICLAAFSASVLTLFSGFGLGTLLMPVIAVFFPPQIAIAMTAIVHLANNLFKLGLLGKDVNWSVFIRFGLPAMLAAFIGALLLSWFSDLRPIYDYQFFSQHFYITPIKLLIGLLILAFVIMELMPRFSNIAFDRKYLPLGGAISGFFGGLSGHQGAFRSMFLLKAGLDKQAFIATGIIIAVMVDLSRMTIYGLNLSVAAQDFDWNLVIAATLSAFTGAFFGAKLLKKVTIRFVRVVVSVLLVFLAVGLIGGVF